MKSEFDSRIKFIDYVDMLKDLDLEEYREKISKYKKKLKTSKEDLVEKILSKKVLNYFNELKNNNITSIVVDEAHHLTSWWSKVLYYLWE
jgi:superfamily II DNA or RNA helicase